MQGGQPGDRPFTAVKTPAEVDKFGRDCLHHLVPTAQVQQHPHRYFQNVDFVGMAEHWNGDIAQIEKDVADGKLELDTREESLIHRKTPGDLQKFWNELKKDVNEKRTMEPHWGRLAQLIQQQRVLPMAAEASQALGDGRPASFGVTQGGDTVIFPSIPASQAARAGPAPCAFARAGHGAMAMEVNQSAIDSGVDVNVGGGSERVAGGWGEAGCEIGGALPKRKWDTATVGDGAFVIPPQACGTLRQVAPRFGIGGPTADQQQVWDPSPEFRAAPAKTRRHMCQQCGHYVGTMRASHTVGNRAGQKVACLVPDGQRRKADYPGRRRNRYKPCTCEICLG